jgi:hypothetical protein
MKKLALAAGLVALAVLGLGYHGAHLPAATAAVDPNAANPNAAPPSQVSWITVRDPREQAFSIQVPQGWKTFGGLFRSSSIDTRMLVDMTSPDGMTNIRIGDAAIPPYRVPGPFAPSGPGIAAYTAANVFASRYGQSRFGSMCSGIQVTKNGALPPKYHPANSAFAHTTGGEAYFSCTKNGTMMSAYVYAETQLLGPGGPGSSWLVVALGSVLTPAAQSAAAGDLLTHVGGSILMNPAWTRMQDNLNNQAAAAINANTQATIARTQQENAREQGMISALNNDSMIDVINGVQQMKDPNTGQQYTTPIGTGNAQWVDGNVVRESAMSPGPGFTQLTPVQR